MRFCVRCGCRLVPGGRHCPACAAPVDAAPVDAAGGWRGPAPLAPPAGPPVPTGHPRPGLVVGIWVAAVAVLGLVAVGVVTADDDGSRADRDDDRAGAGTDLGSDLDLELGGDGTGDASFDGSASTSWDLVYGDEYLPLDVEQPGELTVTATSYLDEDIVIAVQDADSVEVCRSDEDIDDYERCTFTADEAGTYTVVVSPYSDADGSGEVVVE